MAKKEVVSIVVEQKILNKILTLRGEKVMLDKDLAVMYGIETKVFNQAVKRHTERFPKDFMFTLTKKEWDNLRSQNLTSSQVSLGSFFQPINHSALFDLLFPIPAPEIRRPERKSQQFLPIQFFQ